LAAVDALVLDLLEFIGDGERPYAEVMEAWRTSCPRLPVWEEADTRGFIERRRRPDGVTCVALSAAGTEHLRRNRRGG
jgi:D-3-phosphoglycerate dehydrogenase